MGRRNRTFRSGFAPASPLPPTTYQATGYVATIGPNEMEVDHVVDGVRTRFRARRVEIFVDDGAWRLRARGAHGETTEVRLLPGALVSFPYTATRAKKENKR